MRLNHLLSLGYNCGAAYQIRLHTGIDDSAFFDWLYTSVDSAIHLIETDFVGFLHPDSVAITRDSTEVLVQPSGIRLNHSFKPDGRTVDAETMRRDFGKEQDKFNYLASKMRNIFNSGRAIGFVRYNPYKNRHDDLKKIVILEGAIRRRLGHSSFILYWLRNSDQMRNEALTQNLTVVDIDEQPTRSSSYRGRDFIGTDDLAWGEFIANLDVTLTENIEVKNKNIICDFERHGK